MATINSIEIGALTKHQHFQALVLLFQRQDQPPLFAALPKPVTAKLLRALIEHTTMHLPVSCQMRKKRIRSGSVFKVCRDC